MKQNHATSRAFQLLLNHNDGLASRSQARSTKIQVRTQHIVSVIVTCIHPRMYEPCLAPPIGSS
jgi:hypothetical protein